MNPRSLCRALVLSAALLLFAACGDGGLEEATEQFEEMQARVAEARSRVEAHEAEAKRAEAALARSREELAAAEKRLAEARAAVAKEANDAVLFRTVQQRLLDDDDLEGSAVSARVQKRVVTLEGSVPSERMKERAEKIATETAGVETVINQISVRQPGGK